MKQKTNIEKKAKSQIWETTPLALLHGRSGNWVYLKSSIFNANSIINPQVLCNGLNIFLIQNKGKGPPGRARSPEAIEGHYPEHPPDFIPLGFQKPDRIQHKTGKHLVLNGRNRSTQIGFVSWNDQLFENRIHTEYQISINNIFLNFNHTLNYLS